MTFKLTGILFLISILAVACLHYYSGVSLIWLIPPTIIFVGLMVYGSAFIRSGYYSKVYCNAKTSKKEISITFDDGPNEEFTPKVLKVLSDFRAVATFFVIGKNCSGNEHLLKTIHGNGHMIGNHTFNHSFFIDFKGRKAFREEILNTTEAIWKITSKRIRLFRPPYGVTTPHLAKALKDLDMDIIGWNIRSLDTTDDSEERIAKRVIDKIKPGSVILFHDTSAKTVSVLKQILSFVKSNDYEVVNLERLLNVEAYDHSGQWAAESGHKYNG